MTHPLAEIKTFPSLVKYLREELEWEIDSDDFEELTFHFEPEELGIDPKNAAKIKEIKQLRPLVTNQPWGIFFVAFEPKRLPVVALRKLLGSLVIKKRKTAKSAEQAAWNLHDLLFISAFGEGDHRQITLAHFSEGPADNGVPTLKVLGWDGLDTGLHFQDVDRKLHERLRWPDDPDDVDGWRQQWSSAFTLRHREVITTAKDLAAKLAALAMGVRAQARQVLSIETERGPLRKLYAAFQQALIHDLSEKDFADTYAQTITYGLFSAAVSPKPVGGPGSAISPESLLHAVPVTNPFLKETLESFLSAGGKKGKVDFDELGIHEVVEVLNSPDTHLHEILMEFGNKGQGEDPVIHFYEDFLREYDKDLKVRRGVFYTPQPVVSYIVRSVHELLKSEFGLDDGLASTVTWKEFAAQSAIRNPQSAIEIPAGTSPDSPFVTILDPATGTATFLVEVIDLIHKTMTAKWTAQRLSKQQKEAAWNDYVPKNLLPRLFGYELMMAPYAIAHMKIGLKLAETGYKFQSKERARIYLTNALEPPREEIQTTLLNWFPALAHEAAAVNKVKRDQRFTVVIGNPPYAGISSNMSDEAQQLVDAYKVVDGVALNERKLWLQDDYVKFLRKGQLTIDEAGRGVIGYITNHGYVDNPTFRGMRQSLLGSFQHLMVVDLHGNANKKEQPPDGAENGNVFDIRQGVAICLGVHAERRFRGHQEIWGSREQKYAWLAGHTSADTPFSAITPASPYYFLEPQQTGGDDSYKGALPINEIFVLSNSGIVTARDGLVLDFDKDELKRRIDSFCDTKLTNVAVKEKYDLAENYMWRVSEAREELMAVRNRSSYYTQILYRPFNCRHIFFHPSVVWRPRLDVMSQLQRPNVALITTRQTRDPFGALATNMIVGHKSVAAYDINSVFPLYDYPDTRTRAVGESSDRKSNFTFQFLSRVAGALHLRQDSEDGSPQGLSPEDLFNYIYAVLHSPTYRERYAEFLKIEFPRIPLIDSLDLFRALAKLGGELVTLHLMESKRLDKHTTTFVGPASPEVEKVSWAKNTVWLDKKLTRGFRGVPESVWNFHIGGYQVCEKWLKDRKGRTLSKDDLEHYHRIVVALSETIRLMAEIDKTIDAHGGWPGAFQESAAEPK